MKYWLVNWIAAFCVLMFGAYLNSPHESFLNFLEIEFSSAEPIAIGLYMILAGGIAVVSSFLGSSIIESSPKADDDKRAAKLESLLLSIGISILLGLFIMSQLSQLSQLLTQT